MLPKDSQYMRMALRLARRAEGDTAPNPLVGAVLVRGGRVLGRGWHHKAGQPHAEIEALNDAARRGERVRGATIYVTLEPCCTTGRTPPCTDALVRNGIRRVVVAAVDPNPKHAGRAFPLLEAAGIQVESGVLADESNRMNEAFNHWIVHRTPWITLKAAMTLDGRIATASGESKWITGERARLEGRRLRKASDTILVGIQTVLADNPSLTLRDPKTGTPVGSRRRLVLDSRARTPLDAALVTDAWREHTTILVGESAPARRVAALARKVRVLQVAERDGRINLDALFPKLGAEGVMSLLVEGGGEVHASLLAGHHAHRITFFYAPLLLGGEKARRAVAGDGFGLGLPHPVLTDLAWKRLGPDRLLTARIVPPADRSATTPSSKP
jgi:diaminohydroxyphosphoribosylaminopyrimidine deaminase/5-amino-6-(5-phosphoribosylamino)uracil reductase